MRMLSNLYFVVSLISSLMCAAFCILLSYICFLHEQLNMCVCMCDSQFTLCCIVAWYSNVAGDISLISWFLDYTLSDCNQNMGNIIDFRCIWNSEYVRTWFYNFIYLLHKFAMYTNKIFSWVAILLAGNGIG